MTDPFAERASAKDTIYQRSLPTAHYTNYQRCEVQPTGTNVHASASGLLLCTCFVGQDSRCYVLCVEVVRRGVARPHYTTIMSSSQKEALILAPPAMQH